MGFDGVTKVLHPIDGERCAGARRRANEVPDYEQSIEAPAGKRELPLAVKRVELSSDVRAEYSRIEVAVPSSLFGGGKAMVVPDVGAAGVVVLFRELLHS